jgi:hypothetical protein
MNNEDKNALYFIVYTWAAKKSKNKLKNIRKMIHENIKQTDSTYLQERGKEALVEYKSAIADAKRKSGRPFKKSISIDTAIAILDGNTDNLSGKVLEDMTYIATLLAFRSGNNGEIQTLENGISNLLNSGDSAKIKIGKATRQGYQRAAEDYEKEVNAALKSDKAKAKKGKKAKTQDMPDLPPAIPDMPDLPDLPKVTGVRKANCEMAGKMWTTIKGQKRCVSKHYRSKVKCRSKKRKGYVYSTVQTKNGPVKKCVRSAKKKSAICRKRGLVYDKASGKCRKSGVKSRARTGKAWKEHCKSKGLVSRKHKGKYACRKSAKRSRSLSSRRKSCKKGKVFAKNSSGRWVCRKSRKPGRKSRK